MRYSRLLLKTVKESKEFDSINASLLQKAGFIDQTMAGAYTFLPLGFRVLTKIENIVREEMNSVGSEMLMPAIVPNKLWETTGRLDSFNVLLAATPANDASKKHNNASYVLSPTHEEVITPIAQKMKLSYQDLPFAVYQIQTKFRNEERPKSGLLRGREFRMKDLYSFHANNANLQEYYDTVKKVYLKIFDRLGIGHDTYMVRASGGDFTQEFSHEFQTVCETGEDTIYYNKEQELGYNSEVAPNAFIEQSEEFTTCEVGNIFPLGTKFSEAFGYRFTNKNGQQKPVYMASYGIGTTRCMGVVVEKYHDDKGILWPPQIAPFQVQLVGINLDNQEVHKQADKVYNELLKQDIEVLFDDRLKASPGDKLSDADLIGIPIRLIVSSKTKDQVELKKRTELEGNLMSIENIIKAL